MQRIIKRGFFAAVLAGALGFGAAQALAAPADPAERACNPQGFPVELNIKGSFCGPFWAGPVGWGPARPPAAPAARAGRACNPKGCNRRCEAMFGPFASGQCIDGECVCAV